MVKSIGELRKICQKPFQEEIDRRVIRKISIYFTWLLIHTPISANGVTILFLICGIFGSIFLAFGHALAFVGILFLMLHVILDFSDGEVARYKKQTSWLGEFLEQSFHEIVYSTIFLGLGWRVYSGYNKPISVLFFAISGMLFTLLERSLTRTEYYAYCKFSVKGNRGEIPDCVERTGPGLKSTILKIANIVLFSTAGICFIVIPTAFVIEKLDILIYFYGVTRPLRYAIKIYLVCRSNY